jgi:hypothetical protein
MNIRSFVFLSWIAMSLNLSGCEINTCDSHECDGPPDHLSCAKPIEIETDAASTPDAFVWAPDASWVDAAPADATSIDAASVDASGETAEAAAPGSCRVNGDCAIDEDCVGGTCLTRCRASCQCRLGETCVQGYCTAGQPTPPSCVTDCDCSAGQSCISGACQ